MLRLLTRLLAIVLILMLTVLAGMAWLGNRPINPASTEPRPQGEINIVQVAGGERNNPPIIPTINSTRRTTILLLGMDRRNAADAYTLTDTILLLSINPAQQSASLLSIPRDLYVEIPNYGQHRINAAFILGAQEGGDARGAELAMQTIQNNLGINVDHYALIGFDTVVNVIDAFGGVTVRVPERINDPQYPDAHFGYDPFVIEAGEQLLDGATALKYMRSRHGSTDFNRARRQQQVVLAFRDKLFNENLSNLLSLIPNLLEKFKGGFFTDLSTNEIVAFANASADLASFRISSAVLDYEYVESKATPTQGTVLVLRREKVAALLRQLFN